MWGILTIMREWGQAACPWNTEENEEEFSEEEVEITFKEKKLRGKIYYISEDDDREIYEKLPDGELGDCVGKYNEKNRPVFFKK